MGKTTTLCTCAFLVTLAVMWRQPGEAAQQATAALPPTQSGGASTTLIENVVYGNVNGVALHLDVYQPAGKGGLRPAVVLLHGGGWDSLDSTMRGMGQFLARSGFVAFSADYRLLKGKENRWPAQLDDVQRAVRWVRASAATYGVNPERIGAFGHSARSAVGGTAGHGRNARQFRCGAGKVFEQGAGGGGCERAHGFHRESQHGRRRVR